MLVKGGNGVIMYPLTMIQDVVLGAGLLMHIAWTGPQWDADPHNNRSGYLYSILTVYHEQAPHKKAAMSRGPYNNRYIAKSNKERTDDNCVICLDQYMICFVFFWLGNVHSGQTDPDTSVGGIAVIHLIDLISLDTPLKHKWHLNSVLPMTWS